MTDPLARPAPTSGIALPQIDALRALAILFVYMQHLGDTYRPLLNDAAERALPPWLAPYAIALFAHGHWGVDLFFVLSGFSLGLAYARADARGTPPMVTRVFFRRRIARILPAFYVALSATLALRPELFHARLLPAALVSHALILQGYVSIGGIVLIGASWSLSTEASFYAVMPAIAPYVARATTRPRRAWGVAAALIAGPWVVRAVLHEAVVRGVLLPAYLELSQRRWIVCRLDQFVLGMVVANAYVVLHAEPRGADRARVERAAPWAMLFATASLVALFRIEGALYGRPFGAWPYALVSLATALLVLASVVLSPSAARRVSPRALAALGIVSYGFFLYHQLVIDLVTARLARAMPAPTWASFAWTLAFATPLSIAAAFVSFVVVERRFLRR